MNQIIPLSQIPEHVRLYGLFDVNLQERFLAFVQGKSHPELGYYKNDVLAWLRYEDTPILYRVCGVQ